MPVFTVQLVDKTTVARDTVTFRFAKPAELDFRPGQYADFTLLDPPEVDLRGDSREFTISAAPFEETLACTVRLRDSAFKRSLARLPLGSHLEIDAPQGSFVLPRRDQRPAVFLTGGIGVTPARSILAQADHDASARPLVLFYSNTTPETAAFLSELLDVAARNPQIRVVPTMTGSADQLGGWKGATGRINAAMLAAQVPDPDGAIYFLSGPTGMVAAMRTVLASVGIDDDNIYTEEFLGYD